MGDYGGGGWGFEGLWVIMVVGGGGMGEYG